MSAGVEAQVCLERGLSVSVGGRPPRTPHCGGHTEQVWQLKIERGLSQSQLEGVLHALHSVESTQNKCGNLEKCDSFGYHICGSDKAS